MWYLFKDISNCGCCNLITETLSNDIYFRRLWGNVEIKIESEEFKEKRIVQQHQMVNQVSEAAVLVTLLHLRGPASGDRIALGSGPRKA